MSVTFLRESLLPQRLPEQHERGFEATSTTANNHITTFDEHHTMSYLGKRSAGFVDLTGSDDENPSRSKQARATSSQPSQPRASQSLNGRDTWGIGEADEEEEIIDLSQDVDEGHGWICIGAVDGKIVGVRFYDGFATMGEQVMVKREPGNPYDSNAIRINNVRGEQIGHIPRNLAAKLAPFMVRSDRTVLIFPHWLALSN